MNSRPMSNIDKRDGQVQRYANFGVDMMEWADGGYVKYSDYVALLDELEAKDNRINRLEAIVAVAEQRNALMREWKRALKVPCDLVDDQVPVVIHGMVIRLDRLKETEAKLEAAEKRIADYHELISGLVGVSSSILREVECITNAAYAADKGE